MSVYLRRSFFLVAVVTACALIGCSGGGSVKITPVGGASPTSGSGASGTGNLMFRVEIPAQTRQARLRPDYVSPSTQGMTLLITGTTTFAETIGLTPTSPGCTANAGATACTMSLPLAACPSAANCYTVAVATYDGINCNASSCTIPPTAHELSANQNIGFTVAAGKSNTVNLVLNGIPASVAVVPLAGSTLSGSSAAGFAISKCVTAPQEVSIVGVDADGNDIVGAGAPANATLASSDTTNLAVATPAPSASPNVFTLVPPPTLVSSTIPNAHSIVQLTATITSLIAGSAPQSATTNVTFNGDICGVLTAYDAVATAPIIDESHDIPVDATIGASAKRGWFTEQGTRAHPLTGGHLVEFTAGSNPTPTAITAGPDANLWYMLPNANSIVRLTIAGTVTKYRTTPVLASPQAITSGPDGNLWFTNEGQNTVGLATTSGESVQYALGGNYPIGITAGPDGAMWFAEYYGENIGRIDVSTRAITEFPIASTNQPAGITAGNDDALWFTEPNAGQIGRIPITATTSNPLITEFPTPTGNSTPYGITLGPDGNLWFTELGAGQVAKITTAGAITEYPIGLTPTSYASAIVSGPDGALWFTYAYPGADAIERVTTGGVLTTYPLPQVGSNDTDPTDITVGPDGALWFTESDLYVNRIGRLQ